MQRSYDYAIVIIANVEGTSCVCVCVTAGAQRAGVPGDRYLPPGMFGQHAKWSPSEQHEPTRRSDVL